MVVPPFRPLEEQGHLDKAISLYGAGHDMIYRISCPAHSGLSCKFQCIFITLITSLYEIICQDVLQEKMKSLAMIMMPQVTQLVEENVIS